jgi:hypothetical protein
MVQKGNNFSWQRRLGEFAARLNGDLHETLLDLIMDMPVDLRGSVMTSYIITRINAAEDLEDVNHLLEKAREIGLLTIASPTKGLPYYRFNEGCYVPANPIDKRAVAILHAACRRNSLLKHSANEKTVKSDTKQGKK